MLERERQHAEAQVWPRCSRRCCFCCCCCFRCCCFRCRCSSHLCVTVIVLLGAQGASLLSTVSERDELRRRVTELEQRVSARARRRRQHMRRG